MKDLIRKIQIHLETTEECMENTSLPQYVVELLEQDNELLGEVVNKYQAERSYSDEEVRELLDLLKRSITEIIHIKYTYKDKGHCVKYMSDCEAVIKKFTKK